jgi:hypothetical protein
MRVIKCLMAVAVLGGSLVARPAQAQIGFTIFGVGEFDTEDVTLALGGVGVGLNRLGWGPVANLQAYWLEYPLADDGPKDQITGITPSVGLRNLYTGGFVEARVGYTFVNREEEGNPFTDGIPGAPVADTENGVNVTGHLEHWGTTGGLGAQLIGTYNFGAETLWTRGRLMVPLFGPLRVGGELAWLNAMNDDDTTLADESFSQFAAGGVLGFNPGRGVIINGRVGRKFGDADATYFGVELVLTPQ